MIITPAYGARTAVVNGELITASSVNRQFTATNGVDSLLSLLGNSLQTITTSTSATATANQDIHFIFNNTSNATLTLPATSASSKAILVEKGANNYATVQVNRAGSDTINNPFGSLATPVATSFTLYLPGEAYLFVPVPSLGYWRVYTVNCPVEMVSVEATRTSTNQTLTNATWNILQFNNEIVDLAGNYSTSTYTFTAPLNGYYSVDCNAGSNTGNAGAFVFAVWKNGANAGWSSPRPEEQVGNHDSAIYLNRIQLASGDTLDLRAFPTGTQNMYIASRVTFGLVARY